MIGLRRLVVTALAGLCTSSALAQEGSYAEALAESVLTELQTIQAERRGFEVVQILGPDSVLIRDDTGDFICSMATHGGLMSVEDCQPMLMERDARAVLLRAELSVWVEANGAEGLKFAMAEWLLSRDCRIQRDFLGRPLIVEAREFVATLGLSEFAVRGDFNWLVETVGRMMNGMYEDRIQPTDNLPTYVVEDCGRPD